MTLVAPSKLQFPVDDYKVEGYSFGQLVGGRVLPAVHLGEDVIAPAGTHVKAIGSGKVVWSEMRPGSEQKRNWGGVVVLEHAGKDKKFYSVYGHITDLQINVGDIAEAGQTIGVIAPGYSPENGWWKIPHLHFAIYTGPWHGTILPGYWRLRERRTFPWHWRSPAKFIKKYNLVKN